MMPLCPVCGAPLTAEPRVWLCPNRHSFDIARQGYVNLLTVDRKHSLHPGDTREMVAARKAFLDTGHYRPVAEKLRSLLLAFCPDADSFLDAGCGEGYYLSQIRPSFPRAEFFGVDISKDAVRYAAVRDRQVRWLTCTVSALPFADGSFDALLSLFAPTLPAEYARVLKSGGIFLQVLAGEEHLMGLKRIIYPEIIRKEKFQSQALDGFSLLQHETLSFPFTAEGEEVQNLLAMTPHFWRISREGAERLAQTERLDDTARVVFNVYRRS